MRTLVDRTKVSIDTFVLSNVTIVQWFTVRDSRFIRPYERAEIAMATLLSQHAYGRVLLHIVTMLCDGQVRWHCAGIAREVAR